MGVHHAAPNQLRVKAGGSIPAQRAVAQGSVQHAAVLSELSRPRQRRSLSQVEVNHPYLVKPMQERLGCLMYAATSKRPGGGGECTPPKEIGIPKLSCFSESTEV
jgi:hypothetical protein